MIEWELNIVERLGYVGIAFLVALENLIPPIPPEVVLPLAGFSAAQGTLGFSGVLIAATVGSVIGALALYIIGQRVGEERLRRFIDADDIDRAHGWFDRHGGAAVFFGRLIPVVRSGISLPAGFTGMALPLFVVYTTSGSAIWMPFQIALPLVAGRALGGGEPVRHLLRVRSHRPPRLLRRALHLAALARGEGADRRRGEMSAARPERSAPSATRRDDDLLHRDGTLFDSQRRVPPAVPDIERPDRTSGECSPCTASKLP